MKTGNLLNLTTAMDKNEKFFIKCGIFLILEKLKVITYRLGMFSSDFLFSLVFKPRMKFCRIKMFKDKKRDIKFC